MIIKKGLKQNLEINTNKYNVEITGTNYVLDDKKKYTPSLKL
jgi:hypothetical protein